LCAERAGSLLFVGKVPEQIRDYSVEGVSIHQLDSVEQAATCLDKLQSSGSSDSDDMFTLVLGIEPSEKRAASLLGHAIRSFPSRVVVYCTAPVKSPQAVSELFYSLGFRRLLAPGELLEQPDGKWWFEYQLSQYKSAPEWLNAQYWANPERFALEQDPDAFSEYSDEQEE
jgi:hypothetical protein